MADIPNEPSRAPAGASPATERRASERHHCPIRLAVRVMIRPRFCAFHARVADLSTDGMALQCDMSIEAGMRLAVQWEFGPEDAWRTICARVVHCTARDDWGWTIGCELEEPLQPAEVDALMLQRANAATAERYGPTW